ncbi:MAG: efflux RND transporter permease subunit, partial [Alphaproteobacteria bacterium]
RWVIVFLTVIAAAALATGFQHRSFSDDYRVMFSPDNPDLLAHQALEQTYLAVDTVTFVVRPRDDGSVLRPQHLETLADLTERAWLLDYVVRVDSLTNFHHIDAMDDHLYVHALAERGQAMAAAEMSKVENIVRTEPDLFGRLVSEDLSTAVVVATVELPPGASHVHDDLAPAVRQLAADFRDAHPDLRLAVGGHVMLSSALSDASEKTFTQLFPVMLVFLAIALLVFLRSIASVLVAMFVVTLTVAASLGAWFYLGVELNAATSAVPVIILTVAVADVVHMLVTMNDELARGNSRKDALVETLRVNLQPVTLTSLTTAVGFLSLNFSDAPPYRELGSIAATGAVMACILSVLLLPALMAVMRGRTRSNHRMEERAISNLVEISLARPRTVILGVLVVTVALAAAVPNARTSDRFIEFLSADVDYRKDAEFTLKYLPGVYDIAFSVGAGEEGGVADPAYLRDLERFSTWLADQPEIVHVTNLTHVVKRLNEAMHGGDPGTHTIPDRRDTIAQYLLLYEMQLPEGGDLNNMINVDKSASAVRATMGDITSQQMKDVKRRAESWLRENTPEPMHAVGSGVTIMFAFLTLRNVEAMSIATIVAILLISAILIVALRSVKLGILSLVPNFLPPIIGFGIWVLLNGEIGMYAAFVTATALGLIVDFTAHFLSKYLRGRRERGLDTVEAIRYTIRTVGSALWISAMVLIVGFLVLSLSDSTLDANLGLFVALIAAVALVVDLLVLPAALVLIDRKSVTRPATVQGAV